MTSPVTYTRKVRYSDSDAQGIVFNANYFVYADDALTDWFDAAGLDGPAMAERGVDVLLAHAELDFRSAGRIGENLVTSPRVTRIGTSSITFQFEIREERSDRLVNEGTLVYVVVDHQSYRPVPVPAFVVEAIEALQGPLDG